MEQSQQQINQLTTSFNSLLSLFKSHIHNGIDSQKIPTSISNNAIFTGYVVAGGTQGSIFPLGWNVVLNTATYTVTHNLGLSADGYAVTVSSISSSTVFAHITAQTSNSFDFRVTSLTGTNSITIDATFILSV